MIYIVDADDFCQKNNSLDVLFEIKDSNPDFKITLFSIIGLNDWSFLEYVQLNFDWIDICPHGLYHKTSRECQNWTYDESLKYLNNIESMNITKIFKAPGWQISDGMYKALVEKRYAVADQGYNDKRRPKELKSYILDSDNKLHYHIGHLGGHNANEISLFKEQLKQLKGDFKFIKEVI